MVANPDARVKGLDRWRCEFALPLLVMLASCAALAPPRTRYEFSQPKMGTQFRIVLYAASTAEAEGVAVQAFARIDQLNAIMSDYDPESEVNSLACGAPIPVSPDLFSILEDAADIWAHSAGAFDVTIAPLTRLWRNASREGKLPDPTRIAAARECVGCQWLRLDASRQTVQLARPGMHIDLGGIAKGYAVDRAMALLTEHGITSALVAGGGDIRVSAAPPGRTGWAVTLDAALGAPREHVELVHAAVSTSGDTYQFVDIDGVRYSHIVDPSTGMGLTHQTAASVIAPECTTSDALATAVCVLGAQRGLELIAAYPETWARVVSGTEGTPAVRESAPLPDCEEFVNLRSYGYRRLVH